MQKSPVTGAFLAARTVSTDLRHIRGLWSFLALNNFDFDLIAFGERLESGSAYRAEVHEDVGASLTRDESEALRVVEPFHRAVDASHEPYLLPELWSLIARAREWPTIGRRSYHVIPVMPVGPVSTLGAGRAS